LERGSLSHLVPFWRFCCNWCFIHSPLAILLDSWDCSPNTDLINFV
jgi:hypothetical protein